MRFFAVTIFFIVSIVSLVVPTPLFSQTFNPGITTPSVSGSSLTLNVFPGYAKPGEYVEFSLTALSVPLTSSTIIWSIDGKRVASGPSMSRYVYKIPLGTEKFLVTADVYTKKGQTYSAKKVVSPAMVTLLWEGATYTPPFFKGRPTLSPEASLSVHAVPYILENGVELQPDELDFKWTVNGKLASNLSGLGRNTAIIPNTGYLRPIEVIVEVSSQGGVSAGQKIKIEVERPWIVVYENDPLLGIRYDKALGNYALKSQEVTVFAEPYYFSVNKRNDPKLLYSWLISGERQAETTTPSLTLRPQGSLVGGSATIGVSVRNTKSELQGSSQNFTITANTNTE